MPLYMTRYQLPDGAVRVTQCYADSEEHLEEVMHLRGMGETIARGCVTIPPQLPSYWLEKRDYAKAIHALTWAAMIAVKSGTDAWDLLHDKGIMHELAHLNEYRAEPPYTPMLGLGYGSHYESPSMLDMRLRLVDRIKAFEATVPGLTERAEEKKPQITITDFAELEKRVAAFAMSKYDGAMVEFKTAPKKGEKIVVYYDYAAEDAIHMPPRMREGSRDFDKQRLEQSKAAKAKKADLVAKLKANAQKKAVKAPPSGGSDFQKYLSLVMDSRLNNPPRGLIPNVTARQSSSMAEFQYLRRRANKMDYEIVEESQNLDYKVLELIRTKTDIARSAILQGIV